jgi:23S rRNA (adenine-N6)-dimethyltransferase
MPRRSAIRDCNKCVYTRFTIFWRAAQSKICGPKAQSDCYYNGYTMSIVPGEVHKNHRQLSHSQNFLQDDAFVGRLVNQANIDHDDIVLEIGPGKGVITWQLARLAKKVVAIELDRQLATRLKQIFADQRNVEIVQGDFMHFELPQDTYKVFSNIPFNMTADIMNKLLSVKNPPKEAYIIMQDAAADKFIGSPVGPTTQTAILLQPFFDMRVLTKIPKKHFIPMPKIDAVLAAFIRRPKPLIAYKDQALFRDFVVYGYNQWKPTVVEAFKNIFTDRQLVIMTNNLDLANLKPSQLTVQQWIGMFDVFVNLVPPVKIQLVRGAEKRLRSKQAGMVKQHRTRSD